MEGCIMENKQEPVAFQVHEADMSRLERSNKRLLIALVVVVVTMLLNNVVWIAFENHRQDVQNKVIYETQKE